jgi:hypothetical protein
MDTLTPEEVETRKEGINLFMLFLGITTALVVLCAAISASLLLVWFFRLIWPIL